LKVEVWEKHALSKEYIGKVVVHHLGDVLNSPGLVHAYKKKKKVSVTKKIVLEMEISKIW